MKSNLENIVNRFNSSSKERISNALFEENNLKLAELKELIMSKDADVIKLVVEEKASYRDF